MASRWKQSHGQTAPCPDDRSVPALYALTLLLSPAHSECQKRYPRPRRRGRPAIPRLQRPRSCIYGRILSAARSAIVPAKPGIEKIAMRIAIVGSRSLVGGSLRRACKASRIDALSIGRGDDADVHYEAGSTITGHEKLVDVDAII